MPPATSTSCRSVGSGGAARRLCMCHSGVSPASIPASRPLSRSTIARPSSRRLRPLSSTISTPAPSEGPEVNNGRPDAPGDRRSARPLVTVDPGGDSSEPRRLESANSREIESGGGSACGRRSEVADGRSGVGVAVIRRSAESTPPGKALRRAAGGLETACPVRGGTELAGCVPVGRRMPDPDVADDIPADRIRSNLGPIEKVGSMSPHVHVMVEDHVALLHGDVPELDRCAEHRAGVMETIGVRGVDRTCTWGCSPAAPGRPRAQSELPRCRPTPWESCSRGACCRAGDGDERAAVRARVRGPSPRGFRKVSGSQLSAPFAMSQVAHPPAAPRRQERVVLRIAHGRRARGRRRSQDRHEPERGADDHRVSVGPPPATRPEEGAGCRSRPAGRASGVWTCGCAPVDPERGRPPSCDGRPDPTSASTREASLPAAIRASLSNVVVVEVGCAHACRAGLSAPRSARSPTDPS